MEKKNVKVEVRGILLKIPVGNGTQSFKWLASVVQAKLQDKGTLRKIGFTESAFVSAIKNESGLLINPHDIINDHLVDLGYDEISPFTAEVWKRRSSIISNMIPPGKGCN